MAIHLSKKFPLTGYATFLECNGVASCVRPYCAALRKLFAAVGVRGWRDFDAVRSYYDTLPHTHRTQLGSAWRHFVRFLASEAQQGKCEKIELPLLASTDPGGCPVEFKLETLARALVQLKVPTLLGANKFTRDELTHFVWGHDLTDITARPIVFGRINGVRMQIWTKDQYVEPLHTVRRWGYGDFPVVVCDPWFLPGGPMHSVPMKPQKLWRTLKLARIITPTLAAPDPAAVQPRSAEEQPEAEEAEENPTE